MELIQTEAVVLQAIPFKEYDRILTLFSPQGLLKLFVKGTKKAHLHTAALTSPLTYGEYFYFQGKKDLHRLAEGAVIKQNLRLRDRYETLAEAEKIVQTLLKSQLPGKPAPKLFQLFHLFLEHLSNIGDPSSLTTVFLLKTMRHEGLLELSTPLETTYRFAGERYAQSQSPPGSLLFTGEEEELLAECVLSRSFSHISELLLSEPFKLKVDLLFKQAFY